MFVKKCPKCGRNIKVENTYVYKNYKTYLIFCPNFCSVFQTDNYPHPTTFLSLNMDKSADLNHVYKEINKQII